MQVQFKIPVTIGGETFGAGTHNIDAALVKDDWFFDALVKDGSAFILQAHQATDDEVSGEEVQQARRGRPSKAAE